MTPNFDRIRTLAAFVAALPPQQFDLGDVIARGPDNTCGTLACAMGYATLKFPQWWLDVDITPNGYGGNGAAVTWSLCSGRDTTSYQAAAMDAFNISRIAACDLFAPSGNSDYDDAITDALGDGTADTDRNLFLGRVSAFLAEHDQPPLVLP